MARRTLAGCVALLVVYFGTILVSGQAEAVSWWGVCTRGGMDVAAVRGPSLDNIRDQCRRQMAILRSDAHQEAPCSIDDAYAGCELGKATAMCKGGIAPVPAAHSERTISPGDGQAQRTCVHVPKSSNANDLYCDMYDSSENKTYRCGTEHCGGIETLRFTVYDAGPENIYCWTVLGPVFS